VADRQRAHGKKGIGRTFTMKSKRIQEHIISFRVSSCEKEVLCQQAKQSGISISQLLRKKLDLLNNSYPE
jgi:arsenate reductase-like glutaredoxin family protein